PERPQPIPAPRGSCFFIEQSRIAKEAQSCETRFFRPHARGNVLCYLLLQMKVELCLQTRLLVPVAEQRRHRHSQSLHPTHKTPCLRTLFAWTHDACLPFQRSSLNQSIRKASVGSIRYARSAGITLAIAAVNKRVKTIPAKT